MYGELDFDDPAWRFAVNWMLHFSGMLGQGAFGGEWRGSLLCDGPVFGASAGALASTLQRLTHTR